MKQADDETRINALSYAYRLLSYRPRSQKELSQRLERKDFPPEVIQDIIAFLEEKGYLDDLSFARFWVMNRLSARPTGKRLLISELRRKGVVESIIEQVLAQAADQYDEIDMAQQAAQKRFKVLIKDSRLSPETSDECGKRKIKKRLCDYLARRGFSYETILEVVGAVVNKVDDDEH